MPGDPPTLNPMSDEKKGVQRVYGSPRVQVEFTFTDTPEVEIVEEETEKAIAQTRTREKSITPRGGSVTDEAGS